MREEVEEKFKYQEEFNLCINRLKEVFPRVNLEKLGNVNILFDNELEDIINYDDSSRTIVINSEKLDDEIDVSKLIMNSVLEIVSTNNGCCGLNGVELLSNINKGVMRLINNLLISNEEDYDDFSLLTVTNILVGIVGVDLTIDSFFNQKGERFYQRVVDKLGRDNTDKVLELVNSNSNCADVQNLISKSYLQDLSLEMSEVLRFKDSIFTEISLLPDKLRDKYEDCVHCFDVIDDYINKRASADDLEIMVDEADFKDIDGLEKGTVLL